MAFGKRPPVLKWFHVLGVVAFLITCGPASAPTPAPSKPPTSNVGLVHCPKSSPTGNTNVKDSYIKAGTRATCTCELVDSPGETQENVYAAWFDANGDKVDNASTQTQGNKKAILLLGPTAVSGPFECKAVNGRDVNGNTPTKSYTPKFARGPDQVEVKISTTTQPDLSIQTLDLCPANHTLTVTCSVPRDSVSPPNPHFQGSNGSVEVISCSRNTGDYSISCTATLRDLKPGRHRFTCVVVNSLFSDLRAEDSAEVDVRAPPKMTLKVDIGVAAGNQVVTAPTSDMTETVTTPADEDPTAAAATADGEGDDDDDEDAVVNVEEHATVQLRCLATGGDFEVTASDMLIDCVRADGSRIQQRHSQVLTLKNVDRAENDMHCACSVSHVTGCYDNNTSGTVHLRVHPASAVRIMSTTPTGGTDNMPIVMKVIIGTASFVAIAALSVASVCCIRKKLIK